MTLNGPPEPFHRFGSDRGASGSGNSRNAAQENVEPKTHQQCVDSGVKARQAAGTVRGSRRGSRAGACPGARGSRMRATPGGPRHRALPLMESLLGPLLAVHEPSLRRGRTLIGQPEGGREVRELVGFVFWRLEVRPRDPGVRGATPSAPPLSENNSSNPLAEKPSLLHPRRNRAGRIVHQPEGIYHDDSASLPSDRHSSTPSASAPRV